MDKYYINAIKELNNWKKKMQKKPSIINKTSKGIQNRINNTLPDKYHEVLTFAIKNMIKIVLSGSQFMTKNPYPSMPLEEREGLVKEKISFYKKTAMLEGASTGAGGILMGLADFPLLLSIKFKFLYDVAAIYGFDTRDYKERLYILKIFQLAFSSQAVVNKVFHEIENWEEYSKALPSDINLFNWREFQQEYRDYIDIAKLMQIIPGIGAVVGAYTNSKLLNKLGITAMNAYRMRVI
ncbi:EcsC protein family protein [Proteiniborus ethanoligenes]|uniref:EcsC protein family protein n=1 Tax=Proteiniborus ethanoligenes TaxID=415015 RepID=A0A1H3MZG6_9FIRM|nr:EcsC family protein [Proteiniborus ethanoligenes]SDY82067.1 EcsC protein family protein [Proteiniborus ethanoligenes]